HVPVNLRAVAVVGLLIRLAGREVEAAGDLFVEEDILHRLEDIRVEGDGPLADVARALIGVQDLVEPGRLAACRRLDNLAVLKNQPDIVKNGSPIERLAVKLDGAVDRIA